MAQPPARRLVLLPLCLLLGLGARCAPQPALPALVSSHPAAGATSVIPAEWIQLEFASPPGNVSRVSLRCDGTELPWTIAHRSGVLVVINPAPALPPSAACEVTVPTGSGTETILFTTSGGFPVEAKYDRTDPRTTVPFPDDFWLVDDPTTPTGKHVQIAMPSLPPGNATVLVQGLLGVPNTLDGFSPIAPFVIPFERYEFWGSLPREPQDSLDPLAPMGLFDLTPGSPTRGQRVPIELAAHGYVFHPSIPLRSRGRYGLIVTRRVRDHYGYTEAAPSSFFAAALADPVPGEDAAITRVRELAWGVLDDVNEYGDVTYPPEDVALVLSISVRSLESIPDDRLEMYRQIQAAPPPAFSIDSVTPSSGLAALVHGTWQAPSFRQTTPNFLLNRDSDGKPVQNGTTEIPFVLALPSAALSGPVPIVIYQHGSPGCAEEEVRRVARLTGWSGSVAQGGYAVIGFTDVTNREILNPTGPPCALDLGSSLQIQLQAYIFSLLGFAQPPDYQLQDAAEQIAFVRMVQQLGALDCLPSNAACDAGDGTPELDLSAPLAFLGVSMGANHAPGFLPLTPEIRAAALTVGGGGRFIDWVYDQNPLGVLGAVAASFPGLTHEEIQWGLSIFQTAYDDRDPHHMAPYLYRTPLDLGPGDPGVRASILLSEGIGDTILPNHVSRSLAWSLGPIPQLAPVAESVPFLTTTSAPVQGNVATGITAALQQFVPAGVPGLPYSPGCRFESEGHYCAQANEPGVDQWLGFWDSALGGAVPVIDLPPPPP